MTDRVSVGRVKFLALFTILALAEMATFFWVESIIGLGWALGLALLTAVVGSLLVRRAGLSVLARIRDRVGEGRLPGRELTDGAAILVAGALLISPGFLTDTIGFLLLIPAVRGLLHRYLTRRWSNRIGVYTGGWTFDASDAGPIDEDEIIDVDPD